MRKWKLFEPSSLRFQLLSRSLIILSVLLLLIGALQYVFMQQFLYQNKASSVQSQIRAIPAQMWLTISSGTGAEAAEPHERREQRSSLSSLQQPGMAVAFVEENKFTIVMDEHEQNEQPQRLSQETYEESMVQRKGLPFYKLVTDDHGEQQLVVLQPVGMHEQLIGIVQVSVDVKPLQEVLVRQLMIFLSLALVALIIGSFAFLPVLRRTLVPLSKMVESVEQIDAGNLDERFPVNQGQLETDKLSASFNNMLERLEVAFATEKEAKEQMRRFIADASHELRTPITSIRGFLEVLLRGAATSPEKLHSALQTMHGESERLSKLVQDLLFLAKMDQTPQFHLTEVRLDQLVQEMEPQLRLLAGERDVQLSMSTEQSARVERDRIKQVILNLFQNAVQHTDPEQGKLQVSLEPSGAGIAISIQDNGSGIAEEHVPHLFERFYRIDSARARKNGGAGLGLAITKSIVEHHGGTINCASKVGEGTRFTIWLPV